MYSGGFYPFETLEEHWAYWGRYIYINRYQDAPKDTYADLLAPGTGEGLLRADHQCRPLLQKAGFDKLRLFYTQGDYGLWQCSGPCHDKTYGNEAVIRKMVAEQVDMRVPSELVPRCPVCGAPMSMNLRADSTFVEDEGWHQAAARYQDFVRRHEGMRVLYLELGVGMNTPGIIKYPFWKMVYQNPKATYACVNLSEAYCPAEIRKRSICIDEDIDKVLKELRSAE